MAKENKDAKTELSIDEQRVMVREEIERFAQLAKQNGAVTVAEIDELLPAEIVEASVLDMFMQGLEVKGIIVTEHDEMQASNEDGASEEEDELDLPKIRHDNLHK